MGIKKCQKGGQKGSPGPPRPLNWDSWGPPRGGSPGAPGDPLEQLPEGTPLTLKLSLWLPPLPRATRGVPGKPGGSQKGGVGHSEITPLKIDRFFLSPLFAPGFSEGQFTHIEALLPLKMCAKTASATPKVVYTTFSDRQNEVLEVTNRDLWV